MTTTAFLLALFSGLAWSVLDAMRKQLVSHASAGAVAVGLGLGQAVLCVGWSFAGGESFPQDSYWRIVPVVVVLNVVANLLFLRSVTLSPLGRTVPFLAFVPVFATLAGIFVLDEIPRPMQWAGIGLVVVGGFTVNAERLHLGSLLGSIRREPGSPLMLAVGVLWGISAPIEKIGIERTTVAWHATVIGVGVGVVILSLMAMRGGMQEMKSLRRVPWLFAAAVVVGVAAFLLQLLGFREGFVGLVETVKRVVGMPLALLLGMMFFGERPTAAQWGAVGVMSVGVVLVLNG